MLRSLLFVVLFAASAVAAGGQGTLPNQPNPANQPHQPGQPSQPGQPVQPVQEPDATSSAAPPSYAPLSGSAGDASSQGRGPVRISGGVMAGQVLNRVPPVYPAAARAQGLQGTVVLAATIGKDGTVKNLQAISGPDVFRSAALSAVRQWTYRPYLLYGQPTEVSTTITVNFNPDGQRNTNQQP